MTWREFRGKQSLSKLCIVRMSRDVSDVMSLHHNTSFLVSLETFGFSVVQMQRILFANLENIVTTFSCLLV